MSAIGSYIFRQGLIATVAITVGLTFAVWLTQSLRLIDFIVNRGLPAGTFFAFVALLLPSFIGIVLPIATFCAVLFVYHKLIMDSELVVLRAVGMSQVQLARPAFLLALVMTGVVYTIMLYFLPASYRTFKDMQYELRSDYSTVLLQEGAFNTIGDAITVYVRERTADGELLGILVHDMRDPETPVTMMAERGALVQGPSGPRVVMANGNRQEREVTDGRVSMLYFDRYTVELAQFQDTLHTRWRDPKERYLHELLGPPQHPADTQYRSELIAEAHQRLVMPLYTIAFVCVAMAALLSGEFNRRGQTRRVLVAILVIAILEAQALTLHDLTVRTVKAVPAMYAGALVPTAIALIVLLRGARRRAPREEPNAVAAQ